MDADASGALDESDFAFACISQSAGMADADMLETEEETPILVSNVVSAGVFIA